MIFPLLFVLWALNELSLRLGRREPLRKGKAAILVLFSACLTFVPVKGLSLAHYLLSVNPVFSVGSIFLFVALIGKQWRGKPLLSERDLFLFALWNAAVSLPLYLSSLGLISVDFYSYGYGFSFVFVLVAFITIIMSLLRNPLSWVFLAYIAAFNTRVLRSDNFFDYITDGPLFIISLAMIITFIVQSRVFFPEKPRV